MADNPIKTGIMAGVSLMAKEYQKDQFKKNMEKQNELNLQVCNAVSRHSYEVAKSQAGPDEAIGFYTSMRFMHGRNGTWIYCTKSEWLKAMAPDKMQNHLSWVGWNKEWGDPYEEIGKYRLTLPGWGYPGATWEDMIKDMREADANKEQYWRDRDEEIIVRYDKKDPVTGKLLPKELQNWNAYKQYRDKHGRYDDSNFLMQGFLIIAVCVVLILIMKGTGFVQ
jgi:hypothetical protein